MCHQLANYICGQKDSCLKERGRKRNDRGTSGNIENYISNEWERHKGLLLGGWYGGQSSSFSLKTTVFPGK